MRHIGKKTTLLIAFALLGIMAIFLLYTAWTDSATTDELAHIPSGYAYATLHDLRLNPEHPPLVKAFAGFTARLAKNFNFPSTDPLWINGINEEWGIGNKFLYGSGNNADQVIFFSRLGPVLLTLLLGFYIFLWTRELLGEPWALGALFLFVFSPNFVGNGHLVTTDVGAALGTIVGLYYFLKFLRDPSTQKGLIATFALGVALLLKFTTLLLIPVLIILALIWAFLANGNKWKALWFWLSRLLVIGIGAMVIVALVYQFFIYNYPHEKQISDAHILVQHYGKPLPEHIIEWLTNATPLRGLGWFGLGFLMNLQRAAGGNNVYLLGEVSRYGWWYYFPVVYLIKTPLPTLILIAVALIAGLANLLHLARERISRKDGVPFTTYLKNHYEYFAMLAFVIPYWLSSISSPLNIGIRHIFPTIPLVWILALRQVKTWTFPKMNQRGIGIINVIQQHFKYFFFSSLKVLFLTLLAIWYVGEFISVAPHFIAYFNELTGGPKNGYEYVVDSNLDWGQDLKRLRDFVVNQNIQKIQVDYFGGGDPRYYLGNRYEPLNPDMGPQKGWVAISATLLQGDRGRPAPSWNQPCCRYHWLDPYAPVAQIGYSIFVYHIQ